MIHAGTMESSPKTNREKEVLAQLHDLAMSLDEVAKINKGALVKLRGTQPEVVDKNPTCPEPEPCVLSAIEALYSRAGRLLGQAREINETL